VPSSAAGSLALVVTFPSGPLAGELVSRQDLPIR
jgi:hypothetical protein